MGRRRSYEYYEVLRGKIGGDPVPDVVTRGSEDHCRRVFDRNANINEQHETEGQRSWANLYLVRVQLIDAWKGNKE